MKFPWKDISVLFLCTMTNGLYFINGFLFIYHFSFVKAVHPEYPASSFMAASISMDLGIIFGNAAFEKLVNVIRVRGCLLLYGGMVLLCMFVFGSWTHFAWLYFGYFVAGVAHQLLTITIIYFLSAKYKEDLVRFTGFIFTGSSATFCFWGYVISALLNPDNLSETESYTFPNGAVEMYFPVEVTRNFPKFCKLYSAIALVVSALACCFLSTENKSLVKPISEDSSQSDVDLDSLTEGRFLGKSNDSIIREGREVLDIQKKSPLRMPKVTTLTSRFLCKKRCTTHK